MSITGLDCKKPSSIILDSNMPVWKGDTSIDSNMPVLQSKDDFSRTPILRTPEFLDLTSSCYGDMYTPGLDPKGARMTDDYNLNPTPGIFDPEHGVLPENAIMMKEPPRYEGNGNWAPLEGYTLATPGVVPDEDQMSALQRQNYESIETREPSSEGNGNWAPLEGYTLAIPQTHAHPDLAEGRLPLEGKSIRELDPEINPRLGCALAVSSSLHEIDPSFPVTNNNKQLAQLLKKHGYEAVPQNGALNQDNLQGGDVIIGSRPAGMPGHSAIYKIDGKVFENNSDTGTISGDGDFNQFNSKMHDSRGRFNKNGFSDVVVYRKVDVTSKANY